MASSHLEKRRVLWESSWNDLSSATKQTRGRCWWLLVSSWDAHLATFSAFVLMETNHRCTECQGLDSKAFTSSHSHAVLLHALTLTAVAYCEQVIASPSNLGYFCCSPQTFPPAPGGARIKVWKQARLPSVMNHSVPEMRLAVFYGNGNLFFFFFFYSLNGERNSLQILSIFLRLFQTWSVSAGRENVFHIHSALISFSKNLVRVNIKKRLIIKFHLRPPKISENISQMKTEHCWHNSVSLTSINRLD